jgi:phage-related minor tail protein
MEQFGLTSTQAMDFLVAGNQRGLNSSGDLLDTIGEYAVQFGAGGSTAAEFFSILESGNAGGVLGTDKIADAFKEFSIRIVDNSDVTRFALRDIGIDYETLRAGFADGSITTMEAMQQVIEKIKAIEDPIARNTAGVGLFGTQWEDITEDVLLNISTTQTSLESLEGAALSLEEQYKTSGAALESATRKWDNALVDVGEEFNEIKERVLPAFATAVDIFVIPAINTFTDWLDEAGEIVKWIFDMLTNISNLANSLPDWLVPDAPVVPSAVGAGAAGYSVTPMAGASSAAAGAAGYGAVVDSNNETHVNVYVERGGDLDTITDATEKGIRRAQKSRGV